MSNLASEWKTAKTEGEKGLKEVLRKDRNKVSGTTPQFKGDLQKTLDKFEASHDLIEKLKQKLEEEISKRAKLAEDCQKVISSYQKEIKEFHVDGAQSRGKSVDQWTSALSSVSQQIKQMTGN